jgi:DGQHR domain-containing protein
MRRVVRPPKVLRRRALKIQQNDRHPLYLFCLTGAEILAVADISRLSRSDAGKLIGYQRPQVKRHIQDIVNYLNSEDIIFPNSLILALSSDVKFKATRGPHGRDTLVVAGTLEIPLPTNGTRPAWIVDGQQRAVAISKSRRRELPIPVNAFVADEIELQRDQFLRVNNTKPLPRGLITELLPEVSTPLPANLQAKRIPSAVCNLLNSERHSPFYGLIARASTTIDQKKRAVVADTSIIKMIQDSLSTPSGCLFAYRNIATGETDFDRIWATLMAFWTAVKRSFPEAWGKPPSKSRLMHGTGIRAMGRLMDRIMNSVDLRDRNAVADVQHELRPVIPICSWTEGRWKELDNLAWNEIQNVPQHVRLLSNLLVRTYVHGRGGHL